MSATAPPPAPSAGWGSLQRNQIEQKLAQDERLEQTIRVNTPENAMLTFKQVVQYSMKCWKRTSRFIKTWVTPPILQGD